MLKKPNHVLLLALLASAGAMQGFADPDAVDLADSMDFENFHATDVWSIGLGQDRPTQPGSDPDGADTGPDDRQPTSISRVSDIGITSPLAKRGSGSQHRISNPYAFDSGRSNQSAADATELLFRNMAKQCPQGWQKDREWSTPTSQGFLLHYEFHCLTPS